MSANQPHRVRNAAVARKVVKLIESLKQSGDGPSDIARDLEVTERTVYRWAAGTAVPHTTFIQRLQGRLALRAPSTES